MRDIILGESPITIEEVAEVARGEAKVTLGVNAIARLQAGRDLIERFLAEERPVYGMTRGLGQRAVTDVSIPTSGRR